MRKMFQPEEDKVILQNVSLYPNNLAYSFELSAEQLGRNADSCSARYYAKLRSRDTMIAVASANGVVTLNNQKNARRDFSTDLTDQDRLEFVQEMIRKMPRNMKKELVKILFS